MAATFPGEVSSIVDRERGALAEAHALAVRVFGRGAEIRTQAGALGGHRARVLDSASRVRMLTEADTALDALVRVVDALSEMEATS